jgi:hypothetical protein
MMEVRSTFIPRSLHSEDGTLRLTHGEEPKWRAIT